LPPINCRQTWLRFRQKNQAASSDCKAAALSLWQFLSVANQLSKVESAAAATVRVSRPRTGLISVFCHSSVGRKMIVAITGIILILFVIGHLLGNLQIFLGPDWINGYSQHLRDLGPILWLIRAFLLVTVILHIYFTILLAMENRRARRINYKEKTHVKATFASRHMVVSGLVVFAFIIFHLLHFTGGQFNPRFTTLRTDPLNHHDVYSMMVYGFQNIYVSAFYIVGLFLLTLHLTHGSSSFFQSLGLTNQKLTPRLAVSGRVFAWLLFIGYASIPVAVLLGIVQPAQ
jgi:succinate dehydrogenase / fumarate reductase cytochrome b subunit